MSQRQNRQPQEHTQLLVGLTGGIASGKSTVARWFAEAGFHIVDADKVVAELYSPGGAGAQALRDLLGPEALEADGSVNKVAVAKRIFRDPKTKAEVEATIHPLVHRHFQAMATEMEGVVVYEAILLVESGHAASFDLVISIETSPERRLPWAMARGMSKEEAEARLEVQGDGAERRAGADRILRNDGNLEDLRSKVNGLIEEIQSMLEERRG